MLLMPPAKAPGWGGPKLLLLLLVLLLVLRPVAIRPWPAGRQDALLPADVPAQPPRARPHDAAAWWVLLLLLLPGDNAAVLPA